MGPWLLVGVWSLRFAASLLGENSSIELSSEQDKSFTSLTGLSCNIVSEIWL